MITYVFQKNREDLAFQLFIILQKFTREICYFHSLTAINAKNFSACYFCWSDHVFVIIQFG